MEDLTKEVEIIATEVVVEVKEFAEDVVAEVSGIKNHSGRLVHEFLAHSYLIYLASVVVGFGADLIWPIHFTFAHAEAVGLALIVLGTVLAVWAQTASGRGAKVRNAAGESVERDHFRFGPYGVTRTPTQYGLFFMTAGLAILYGFLFMLLTSIVAFLAGKLFFIRKEEQHLAEKYGDAYLQYKKRVRF